MNQYSSYQHYQPQNFLHSELNKYSSISQLDSRDIQRDILQMTIDLGEGNNAILRLKANDDPHFQAKMFCKQHNLDSHVVNILEQNIRKNLEQVIREQQFKQQEIVIKQLKKKQSELASQSLQNNYADFKTQPEHSKPSDQMQQFYAEQGSFSISKNKIKKQNELLKEDYSFTPQINKNSQLIASQKFNSNVVSNKVHNRLYNDALVKNKKKDSQKNIHLAQNNKDKVNSSSQLHDSQNCGELLYHKGFMNQEQRRRKIEKQKQEILEKELEECTHQPYIDPVSRIIAENKRQHQSQDEYFQNYIDQKNFNINVQKDQLSREEVQECTFQPKINQLSEQINFQKHVMMINENNEVIPHSLLLPKHERLHILHKQNQEKKQKQKDLQIAESCTFQPQINASSRQLFQNSNFYERMNKFNEIKKENIEVQTFIDNQPFDMLTGQQFFSPRINTTKEMSFSSSNLNQRKLDESTQNYLHSLHEQKLVKQQQQKDIEIQELKANANKANKNSQKLYDERIKFNLLQIFNLLDSDGDGVIAANANDISKIDCKILECFTPLLVEMENQGKSLNFVEFYEVALILLKHMNVQERQIIYNFNCESKVYKDENCTFKPKLNEKSIQIANYKDYLSSKLYEKQLQV